MHGRLANDVYDNAWMRLGDTSKIQIASNPLIDSRSEEELINPGLTELKIMTDPRYLSYTCKVLFNIDILPEQSVILEELWNKPFSMFVASRGFGKSYLLAVYAMLKLALTPQAEDGSPGVKIVIVGAAFRQSKLIMQYMETIWSNAPILRSVSEGNRNGPRHETDRHSMYIGGNWAIAIPLGDGSKIRGLRANIVLVDEFAAVSPDVYETVIAGFAAVSADPIGNVKDYYKREAMKADGVWDDESEAIYLGKKGNQAIISGTADYDFKHFADYWKKYCNIIRSKGSNDSLRARLGDSYSEDDELLNHKDYSVIRIPYEIIPPGFMDDKIIARAKATVHQAIYQMEYGTIFVSDSDGFFKRSLIESCVGSDIKPIKLMDSEIWFDARKTGSPNCKYVYGIDPASEKDNFCIVVLELHNNHTRVVYCWTTNRRNFKKVLDAGLTEQHDFYGYCARKIRDLMRVFPCEAIGMDAQGGGIAVEEALHDPDKIKPDEIPLWPIIDKDKKKDTDIQAGLHILEMIQFAKADWTADANHGLRKDLEDKVLIFPRFDPVTLELSLATDKIQAEEYKKKYGKDLNLYDTLEDCVMELEELKNELTTIVMTRTGLGPQGRDKWDTPEIVEHGRKGRMRKDRYSSLVMANMVARQIHRTPPPMVYETIGGFVSEIKHDAEGELYQGPAWFTDSANKGGIGFTIKR